MNSESVTYNLPHCYLEVARGVFGTVHHPLGRDGFEKQFGDAPNNNTIFAVVSVSVVFSFLAVEAFVNYQLFRRWESRHDGKPESRRLLEAVGIPDIRGAQDSSARTRVA